MRYVIDQTRRMVLTYGDRVADYAAAAAHQDLLLSDPQFDPAFNQLADFTMVEKVDMNAEELQRLAQRDIFAAGTRRAGVVRSPLVYGLLRMFAVYRHIHGGHELMDVFFQPWAAVKWLKRSKHYETTRTEIVHWFQQGVLQKSTHMILLCDTFEWEDFPVYVSKEQDVIAVVNKYVKDPHHRVAEVYNLRLEVGVQLEYGRAFNL